MEAPVNDIFKANIWIIVRILFIYFSVLAFGGTGK